MGRVGKPALQMRGEAIARDDVEADAGQKRHAGPPRLGVAREQRLEYVDLPGDVEVVRARLETGVGHRPRRGGERPGGVEDDGHAFQRGGEPGPIGETEGPPGQAERFRDGLQPVGASAREHDACAFRVRLASDELSGVAGRAVEEDGSWHFAALQSADGRP